MRNFRFSLSYPLQDLDKERETMECKSLIRGKQGMDQTKKEALTSSLAVFPGYLVVGIAFGLLAQQHQIGWAGR